MLGGRPQGENQVVRVDGGQLTAVDPVLNHRHLGLHRVTQRVLQLALNQRCALHHFHAEQP